MTYQWSAGDVRTRQHRAATAPASSQAPFSAIPSSLIPGRRHKTFSATSSSSTSRLLYFGPGSGTNPTVKAPATTAFSPVGGDTQDYFSMNPSPYYHHDLQPPPPPLPQSPPPQPVRPPLPPKTPVITSPTSTPTLPPKPPQFSPPPTVIQHTGLPRSRSQPYPLMSRSASNLPHVPPPPPPPKPLGARSTSLTVTRSPNSHPVAQPNISPSARPISTVNGPPDTNDTTLMTLPSNAKSPAEDSLPMNEEEELKLALALSEETERERTKALAAHNADLEKAIERSVIESARRPGPSRPRPRPSTLNSESAASSSSAKPRDARPHSQKATKGVTLSPVDLQLKEDEALARQLDAENDSERPTSTPETNHRVDPQPSGNPNLPHHPDVVGKETVAVRELESDTTTSSRSPPVPLTSANSREQLPNPDQVNAPPRNTPSPAQSPSPSPEPQDIPASPEEAEALERSPNQFVEPELLYGASFGNRTPPMENTQFQGFLPNVILLPHGKAQPMHIRASSWRHLLKLLAKLGDTRIQPTVEALAATKGELRLRTVIQFFKLHPSSSDWRTVIYLTIDHPPPPDYRFLNGDVNVLPYSYNLSTLPALLRDGPNSPISKYYTIPATSTTPLPKLPLSLPDMAMYLASALADSRRAQSDSSSGVRRLAKMINQFYPSQQAQTAAGDEEDERPRRGRALIGRLIGRQSKREGGNAEVFDLVTPFFSDDWG